MYFNGIFPFLWIHRVFSLEVVSWEELGRVLEDSLKDDGKKQFNHNFTTPYAVRMFYFV